jgi:hypothetical protein
MAGEQDDDEVAMAHGPRECMPCRGSGKLISKLGGELSTVTCPWCEGDSMRIPGVDAQAKWRGGAGESVGGS